MSESTLEIVAKQAQQYYKYAPVIILGSGASAAYGMAGMQGLAEHLIADVDVSTADHANQAAWNHFCTLLKSGVDLETALHKVALPEELTNKVVRSTWGLLNPQDLKIFYLSMSDNKVFPLGKMLRHLLKSTQSQINIITSNYDRLAEYACEQEGIHHYTGFSYGFRRHAVPKDYILAKRQVNIWKVHGSLDWFSSSAGGIVCLGNSAVVPENLFPMIVTPGIAKYRNTHREPYKSIIHEADNVIDAASAYLCIGFGFNDEHIQEKLVNRCSSSSARIIVITYALSDSAKKFLFSGKVENYLAIERGASDDSSIVHSSNLTSPVHVDANIWSLQGFNSLIM
jgi:hypothetical protein